MPLAFIHIQLFGVHLWEIMFADHCFFFGVLIYNATFLPQLLGGLMIFAAFGYGLNGFGNILAPDHATVYLIPLGLAVVFGELSLMFWLLIKKVDNDKWNGQKNAANKDLKHRKLA